MAYVRKKQLVSLFRNKAREYKTEQALIPERESRAPRGVLFTPPLPVIDFGWWGNLVLHVGMGRGG